MEKKQTHLVYGIIAGIGMVIIALILHLTGMSFVKGMSYLTYVPLLVCLILNANAYSKANNGFVTFGNAFGSCFKATMISTIFMLAWGIVILVAFPEMKEKAMEMARTEAAKNPAATDDMVDMAVNIIKKGWSVFVIAGSILGPIIAGALCSLIAAAIAPKKPIPMSMDNI